MIRRLLPPALLVLAALVLLSLAVTRRDLSEPHVRLFSDMVTTPALRPQSRLAMAPPAGSIPRDFSPMRFGAGAAEALRAGRLLKDPLPHSLAVMGRGRQVYDDFCLHCHGPKGRGDGAVAKAFPGLSFSLAGKSTFDLPDGALFHVVTFGRNNMPSHAAQISQEDRWSVVRYLRDLQVREIARLGPLAEIPEDPRRTHVVSAAYGREVFAQNCASCHGPEGRAPQHGVPTLHSPAVLAIADDGYYWSIINHGRKGTQMPAWKDVLTPTQIQSLIGYVRSWAAPSVDRAAVLVRRGDLKRGQTVYRGHCAGCHGERGKGGIGNTLNSPTFLALTSEQYFRDTVLMGRRHTAMPASYDFSTEDVGDLVAYMSAWAKPRHSFEEVRRLRPRASAEMGGKIFRGRCASCHGERGEGGIGSRLKSRSFLRLADERFLFRAISEGRPGTAMPAWYFLPARDMADLLALFASWREPGAVPPAKAVAHVRGDADFGRLVYEKGCKSCHGPEGSGGVGGQLGNPAFLSAASDDFLWNTIAHGKDDTAMRSFLAGGAGGALMALQSGEIDHVVAYLRSLAALPRVDPLQKTFPGASAAAGKEVFEGRGGCFKCHGVQGVGASGPSLNSPGFLRVASDGFLAATIILGREGTEMQSYYRAGNVHLSAQEVMDTVAYIRTFEQSAASPLRIVERSASSVAEGKTLYARNCAGCHGREGRGDRGGGYAPSLDTQEFLRAADDNFLQATIALGRPNTPMRPFAAGAGGVADLSAAEIRKIVSYIRSWEQKP